MIRDDDDGGSTQNLAPMPKQNRWSVLWWGRSTSSGANAHVLEPRAASASVSCTLQITEETPVDLLV